MPPCDDPDGNTDLKSKHESSGDNSRGNKSRKGLKFDMKMTPVVEKLGPKPARLSSKGRVLGKSLSALILGQLDQCVKWYCSEKNSMYHTAVLLGTLLVFLFFSLLHQLLEIFNILRMQLLPSSLVAHIFQLCLAE